MNTKTKKYGMLVVLTVLLIGVVLISGCIGEEKVKSGENQSVVESEENQSVVESEENQSVVESEENQSVVESGEIQPTEESGKGTVVFAVKDAAANMGAISSVNVTIDKIEVHSNKTNGWITVSNTTKTYDLLELKVKGATELVSSANLDVGTYDQMRLYISNVVVVENNVEKEVMLPSNKLKIIADLEVKENETSTATFDFIADESLHVTGEGKIIMAPVIKVETKTNTKVETKAENKVEIKGGKIKSNITVGMNEDGDIGEGVKIKPGAQLIIEDGKVKILTVSSEQVLDMVSNLNIVAGGEAEMKGSTWIVRGIDAKTNETVEIKINGITGAVIERKGVKFTTVATNTTSDAEVDSGTVPAEIKSEPVPGAEIIVEQIPVKTTGIDNQEPAEKNQFGVILKPINCKTNDKGEFSFSIPEEEFKKLPSEISLQMTIIPPKGWTGIISSNKVIVKVEKSYGPKFEFVLLWQKESIKTNKGSFAINPKAQS